MAKATHESSKTRTLAHPTWYGSHASMVDEKLTAELNDPSRVVCVGESGPYTTFKNRLDNGMADPNRYQSIV